MLEECGLKYETVPIDMRAKQHKSPEYLKINPNGKVPTLVDNEFTIWESIAINRYLAEKYKPELLGKTIEEKAIIEQWSVWSMTECQPPLVDLLIQMVFVPEPHRDLKLIEKANAKVPEKLSLLDKALARKDYIVGSTFSMADLNLASVVNIALGLSMNLQEYKNLTRWMESIKQRPSFKKFAESKK